MKAMMEHGYTVRFRVREQRKRKRKIEGKRTRFYEGEYIYLRVSGPDGVVRDLYLGTATASATPAKRRGEKRPELAPASSSSSTSTAGGRKQGGKAWRSGIEPYDREEAITRIAKEARLQSENRMTPDESKYWGSVGRKKR